MSSFRIGAYHRGTIELDFPLFEETREGVESFISTLENVACDYDTGPFFRLRDFRSCTDFSIYGKIINSIDLFFEKEILRLKGPKEIDFPIKKNGCNVKLRIARIYNSSKHHDDSKYKYLISIMATFTDDAIGDDEIEKEVVITNLFKAIVDVTISKIRLRELAGGYA